MRNRFKTLDLFLYLVPLLLSVVSVLFIYTLTNATAGPGTAVRQGVAAGLGAVGMVLLTFTDYRAWRAWRPWLFLAGIASLVAVRFLGKTEFGATSWIDFGFFQFQPAEFAKLVVIVTLAGVLQTRQRQVTYPQFLLALAVLLLPVALVLLQPDFGTALVISIIGLAVLLHARLRRLQRLVLAAGVAAVVGALVLSFHGVAPFGSLLKGYQKDRLASFIDPSRDPGGSGYNVLQSKIAVGSGGLLGRGLGYGSQSQLNFLPVVQSDFIFAAIAEAWGLAGSYGLIALYILLVLRLVQAARIAQDEFGTLVCLGVAAMLLFQVVENIGMNIGVMPVTGIPLPFLSAGGTALLTYYIALGIAQSVVIRSKRLTF